MIETIETAEPFGTLQRKLILSIEAALEGGSLSILEDQIEIAGWNGTLRISKAEEILEQTARLLNENQIAKNQIKLISVSRGVGSSTGQKIGLALAKGLAKAFDCDLITVCVLEALLLEIKEPIEGDYITAVDSGNSYVWWQAYRLKNKIFSAQSLGPRRSTADEFYDKLAEIDFRQLIYSTRNITDKDSIAARKFLPAATEKLILSHQSPAKLIGGKAAPARLITKR